ncbi:peptidylprolyl isomerase [Roseburia sp. 499]|uniref:peptidylprolyl isomerase n=1 Tax=Roseburia sp. 499 TaxID=1261634 RepID=UPI0009529B2D|nr:peptidylprolyl isomerase [Roseburia sp. 499]WVK68826.1 peptidylprolyl isomerase [Roseburia sp. 499]
MSEKVLAVAAGHEITEKEVNDLIKNYPPEQQIYMSSPQAKQQVLEQIIAFHLFHKMAIDEKIPESKEYKEMIEKMQVELASHMAATSVIEGIKVEEAEEKAFYEENPDLFAAKPQVSAKHILVETEDSANDIAKEIADGLAFEEAAKKYSTCPSKEQGGDLGYFSRGQMVPEFEKAAFEGEIGKVIGPVQTQFGYHLIRVEDKKEGSVIPFEQVKDQIHQQLIQNKQKEVYDAKVKELETKYGVERKDV